MFRNHFPSPSPITPAAVATEAGNLLEAAEGTFHNKVMHVWPKLTLRLCVTFMIFGFFSCKAQNLPVPPSPSKTSNPVELLDFVNREVSKIVQPGITTQQIEQYVDEMLKTTNATLYFKGYHGYPNIITLSVNNEVISAPPSKRVLKEGDLLNHYQLKLVGWGGTGSPVAAQSRLKVLLPPSTCP